MMEVLNWVFGINTAHAVANPTLINAVEDVSTAASENVTGVIGSTTVVTTIGVFLAITIGVGLLFRLLKRSSK